MERKEWLSLLLRLWLPAAAPRTYQAFSLLLPFLSSILPLVTSYYARALTCS